ncbi:NAD(P)/FAD-dependent oxidoreductase [Salinibacter ruber]|uniref:NAD(P)/FAD-dependent oxidoreductase n=1 Tax=Salinibacter ruber TaxID=146919 RepID=UPI0021674C50|nr:NAD(P)/FAD-dependent oxidoreductase [Salinibacter ruber]
MDVVVIGAGATGLAAGYLLSRKGADVTILEASSRPGGLLSTFEVGKEHRLEYFYHHFFTHDAEIHWLLDELGLSDRTIYRPATMGVFRDATIHPFNGPTDVLSFPAMSVWARLRFGLSASMLTYLPGVEDDEQTPALEWFRRWAGEEATEAIWEPMMDVKFGDAADRIPVAWMAGRLRQRARSREGTEEKLGYLEGSLQVLVNRLVEVIQEEGGDLQCDTPVEQLAVEDGRVTGVVTSEETMNADAVLSTVPTPILARLVEETDAEYASSLRQIEYMGAICTILSLKESLSPVYWLNVADSGFSFGGVIEQTRLIPPDEYGGRHLVYLSRYVHSDHALWKKRRDHLIEQQMSELKRLFGRDVGPILNDHWLFRGRFAAPITGLGFSQLVPSYDSPVPGLFTACMPQVYPDERSTNNSIRIAAGAVDAMGVDTSFLPQGPSLAGRHG